MFDSTADSDGDGTGDGGGISIYVGSTMGTYNVANSIIAGNNDGSPGSKAPDCADLAGTIISAGYRNAGEATAIIATNQSFFTPVSNLPDAIYTWTVRAYDLSGNVSDPLPEATFAIAGSGEIYLPVVIKN